jgi:hypothetical protein
MIGNRTLRKKANMDIVKIRTRFQGVKFSRLILHQRKSADIKATAKALQETVKELPADVQPLMESWIDEMGSSMRLGQFWGKDSGDVFDTIVDAAKEKLQAAGAKPADPVLFNMFQVIVLNFASVTPQSHKSNVRMQKSGAVRVRSPAARVQSPAGWHPWPIISNMLHPTLALIVTFAFSVWGMVANHPYVWIPYTGVLAGIVILLANSWANKNERWHQWMAANEPFKFVFSLMGMYLLFAQIACAVLGFYWIV